MPTSPSMYLNIFFSTPHSPTPSFAQLTAVRHERPWRDWKSKDNPFEDMDDHASEEHQARDAWWQWFELNPVEVGSEELEGWIPLWSE